MAKLCSILLSSNWRNYIVICWLPSWYLFFHFSRSDLLLVSNYVNNIYLFQKLNIFLSFKEVEIWLIQLPYCEVNFSRSSHQSCSMKKSILRNFTKFKGKHLCQSLFLIKTLAQVFSCEFCEISKNTFFTEHLWTTALLLELVRNSSNVVIYKIRL